MTLLPATQSTTAGYMRCPRCLRAQGYDPTETVSLVGDRSRSCTSRVLVGRSRGRGCLGPGHGPGLTVVHAPGPGAGIRA
jgi:hypothetical protein